MVETWLHSALRQDGEFSGLTAVDGQLHGHLLHNGSELREGGEAAVVATAVSLLHVGEVQVSLLAHVHALVLLDVLQLCKETRAVKRGEQPCLCLSSYHIFSFTLLYFIFHVRPSEASQVWSSCRSSE